MMEGLRDQCLSAGEMEEYMAIRLALMIAAAAVAIAGITAAAYSFSLGHADQAIAFGWPALSIATMIAIMIPARRRSTATPQAGGLK